MLSNATVTWANYPMGPKAGLGTAFEVNDMLYFQFAFTSSETGVHEHVFSLPADFLPAMQQPLALVAAALRSSPGTLIPRLNVKLQPVYAGQAKPPP